MENKSLNERILDILNTSKEEVWTTDDELNDLSNEVFDPEYASKAIELLVLQEKIDLLNDIFGDGLGNIDDNCSKDDLLENYQSKITELSKQLNELK